MDQQVTKSMTGSRKEITLFDFTQNFSSGVRGVPWRPSDSISKVVFAMSGTGFDPGASLIKQQRFDFTFIDPKFDERCQENKFRIRSFEDDENIRDLGGEAAPVYEILPSEEPQDDNRFIVENSFVQALNEDIINVLATLEDFNEMIGDPELLFSSEYPDIRFLRSVYFNRLTSRIKIKEFFEFYRWFDDAMGILIERLMPKKTDFLGVQFTIESHMLERTKFRYDWQDQYIPPGVTLQIHQNPWPVAGGFQILGVEVVFEDNDFDYTIPVIINLG